MTATVGKPAGRKATPARKKAAKAPDLNGVATANGAANGVVAEPLADLSPAEFVPTTTPLAPEPAPAVHAVNTPAAPAHPYGDREVFVYTPKPGSQAGDAPLVFPHVSTVRPTVHFLWKLRKMRNSAAANELDQAFEWLDLAEVPDDIQERWARLPEAEQGEMLTAWFAAVVTPQPQPEVLPGES